MNNTQNKHIIKETTIEKIKVKPIRFIVDQDNILIIKINKIKVSK